MTRHANLIYIPPFPKEGYCGAFYLEAPGLSLTQTDDLNVQGTPQNETKRKANRIVRFAGGALRRAGRQGAIHP